MITTERTPRQTRCSTTYPHVSGVRPRTVTPSDRTSRRSAAPILLPESDTVADCERETGRAAPTAGKVRTSRSASARNAAASSIPYALAVYYCPAWRKITIRSGGFLGWLSRLPITPGSRITLQRISMRVNCPWQRRACVRPRGGRAGTEGGAVDLVQLPQRWRQRGSAIAPAYAMTTRPAPVPQYGRWT